MEDLRCNAKQLRFDPIGIRGNKRALFSEKEWGDELYLYIQYQEVDTSFLFLHRYLYLLYYLSYIALLYN